MSRKHLKRYLMLLSAVGLLAIGTAGSGTFASFNAEVANPGNYFATGTIFLHATKTGGTGTCKSETDTTNNQNIATTNGCDTLFTLSNAASGATGTIGLTLDNAGSINAGKLAFALGAACTSSKSTITTIASGTFTGTLTSQSITVAALPYKLFSGTSLTLDNGTTVDTVTLTANASSGATAIVVSGALGADSYTTGAKVEWGTQFGTPTNLCTNTQVYVEEDATLGGSPTKCLFGGNAGTAGACTFGSTGATGISGIGTVLTANQFTNATLGVSAGNPVGALDAGGTRFLKIGYQLPTFSGSNQGNQDQNTAATFDLKWHIEQ